jgi:hypothetical protein
LAGRYSRVQPLPPALNCGAKVWIGLAVQVMIVSAMTVILFQILR